MRRWTLRIIGVACAVLALAGVASARPAHRALDLSNYQDADGAIRVHQGANLVDPYFATKALLVASRAGLDITAPATLWMRWLSRRIGPDGRIARFCRDAASWRACQAADADDAMLGLWLDLIATVGPRAAARTGALATANLTVDALSRLQDPQGVFRAAPDNHEHFLMDNCEIAAALTHASTRRIIDQPRLVKRLRDLRERLLDAMPRVFPAGPSGLLRYTDQATESHGFYPVAVAHLYPALEGIGYRAWPQALPLATWYGRYRQPWLALVADTYPWGLVAIVAMRQGDTADARCWKWRAARLRGGERWNVLEEATWQSIPSTPARGMRSC